MAQPANCRFEAEQQLHRRLCETEKELRICGKEFPEIQRQTRRSVQPDHHTKATQV